MPGDGRKTYYLGMKNFREIRWMLGYGENGKDGTTFLRTFDASQAIPRIGDTVRANGHEFQIQKVVMDLDQGVIEIRSDEWEMALRRVMSERAVTVTTGTPMRRYAAAAGLAQARPDESREDEY